MSRPYRLTCHTEANIPSLTEIQRLATREQHLVLQFPPTRIWPKFDKRRIINILARELPEYSVFNSGAMNGTENVTIKAVIPKEWVLAHAEVLVAAARQFRASAYKLISLLAQKLSVPIEAFGNEGFRFTLSDKQYTGELADGWLYGFHGYECRFENKYTKQVLDVKLGFHNEWGVLDAYFFHQFLQTTPGFKEIADLLENGFHDTRRALDILEAQGLLRIVVGRSGQREGRVA